MNFTNHTLHDITGALVTVDYANSILYDNTGLVPVLNWSTQQPSSGAVSAGGTYTSTEQTMIQEMYDALRVYGLLS